MTKSTLRKSLRAATAMAALGAGFVVTTHASAQIEEIVVTSQRREQSVQSIPISVTAFDAAALESQQIEGFSDLQFNTPNVNFTSGNFGGGNFQIRGIGSASIADSGDGGVGMHINDVPIRGGHLFEMEYYDVERIEVMRGPQGTLFGRNATGGAVNLITKKADTDDFYGSLKGTVGNYGTVKMQGMLNVPFGDSVALRLSGLQLERDGYTKNLYSGNDIDGRDQYSVRAAGRWEFNDRLTFDVMFQRHEEDSSRSRAHKNLCHRDPSALYGCLPDKLAYESVNTQSLWPNLFASSLIVGPLLAIQGGPYDPAADSISAGGYANPADMRRVNIDFEPEYYAKEDFYTWGFTYEFDTVTMTYIGSHRSYEDLSREDFNQAVDAPIAPNPIALAAFPITASILFPDPSLWPTSAVTNTITGSVGGHVNGYTAAQQAFDVNRNSGEADTHELRFQSDTGTDFDWLFGMFYMSTQSEGDYFVNTSGFDYLSMILGPIMADTLTGNVFGVSAFDGLGIVSPMFNSETADNTLETWALFGEGYWRYNDQLKFTLGLRYTNDEKAIKSRSTGFDLIGVSGNCTNCLQAYSPAIAAAMAPYAAAIDANLALITGGALPSGAGLFTIPFDEAPNEPYDKLSDSWSAVTGRLAFDYTPELDFTDSTLIYGSISRGYKGGGFNPGVDASLGSLQQFDPEFIWAYELGMKNDFADNRIRWNVSGFYYDYTDYQVAKITNRSAANENVDATIWGLESEMFIAPNENLLFNVNLSYLNTEVQEFFSIDPRDVTGGRTDVALIKDPTSAAQCVIHQNGGSPLDAAMLGALAGFQAAANPLGAPLDPANYPNFQLCDETLMNAAFGFVGEPYTVSGGVEQDLTGNQLPNSPEWSMSVGAQYTHFMKNGGTVVGRVDYFRQDEMWGRIFNRNPIDRISSWSTINASLAFAPEEENWEIKAFIQNLKDDDNMTGMYVTDPAAGLFTNAFLLEPRVYGVSIDVRF